MAGTRLTYHVDIDDKELEKMVTGLIDDTTMIAIHNEFAKTIDPWVPFLEGNLSQQLDITAQGVEYTVPYSRRQYFGEWFNHTTDFHPLATAKWDEVAMQTQLEVFREKIKQILERRAKELYG